VCAVCDVTISFTSYSCFQTNVLAKFVDAICIFFYTHSPYFMRHCTEYKLYQRSTLGYRRKINSTLRQPFITAKISGCTLKQGSKTHSSLRQSNLQLPSQAAPMSRRRGGARHFHLGGALEWPVLQQGELSMVCVGLSERDLKNLGRPGKILGGQWNPPSFAPVSSNASSRA